MKQVIRKAGQGRESIPALASILMLITIVASLICLGYPSNPVGASDFIGAYEFKLTADDGATADHFGGSVAISGDTVVVGAAYDEVGANTSQGSAYVFTKNGTNWTQQAHLTAGDGAALDYFGTSVAISGDTVLVGADLDDVGANTSQGSAYVFIRSGSNWTQQAKLTANDGEPAGFFGSSVALSGDTALIGAPGQDAGMNASQGAAYVFTRSGAAWTQQAKLTAGDGAGYDLFGSSVGLSGNTAVVGAYYDDVGANSNQGSAYVFVRNATSWTEQAKLTASDGAAHDYFGISVAISDDTVLVGADYDDVGGNADEGSAYVFTWDGTSWTEQAHLTTSDGAADDEFGGSVAINGDTALIGAIWQDVGVNSEQGSVYVFTRSGTTWTEQTQLTASDGAAHDYFGRSVALNGDTAVVGAYYGDIGGNTNQGSAYVYDGGEHTAQVSATVTLQSYLISVVISDGYPTAVEYGVMLPNTVAAPTTYIPGTYSYLRVENDGNVDEDLLIKGADAICETGTWILAATPGSDQYSHLYGLGQTPGSYTPLDTSAKNLSSNVTVGGTVDFNVKIETPTDSTVYGQYSTTVTVLAVAAE
jgi:hypothetical protein